MKAYRVNPINEFYSCVVFAETPGKAKSYILGHDGFDDIEFVDIEVHRLKSADCMYKNRLQMDWFNDEDRLFLVKECGWYCGEYFDMKECEVCCANKYCEYYQDALKEEQEWLNNE